MLGGGLDGLPVKITKPAAGEVPNSSLYYNKNGICSLKVQEMCDSKYRFIFLSCMLPGSNHDSTSYAFSCLCRQLEQ